VEATVTPVALDATLLDELRRTMADIDKLQQRLKELVSQLQEGGASAQEIAEALRG
jgi:DNA-directed RNA polymerase specialized sigma24 family protein